MAGPPCAPKYTTRPRVSIISRSNRPNAYAVGLWMVAHTVTPPDRSPFTTVITSFAVKLSSPDVGSSRKRTRGEVMMAMPMLVRFACPPLMPLTSGLPILTSRQAVSASASSTSSTAAFLDSMDSVMGRFISAV